MQQTDDFAIRDSHLSDLPALYRICLETGLHGVDATGTVDPEILGHCFVGPYAVLEQHLSFVLTMNGTPVGYIVGTADSRLFRNMLEQHWWPTLRKRYSLPDDGDSSRTANMIRAIHAPGPADELSDDYPAHLHINILPVAQGTGHGRKLIETFTTRLTNSQVKGLHFGVSAANPRAIGFYRHMGFDVLRETRSSVLMGCRLPS